MTLLSRYFSGIFLLLFLVASTRQSTAQPVSFLGKFSGSVVNGTVLIQWEILQGNTCDGILILRSTDNIHFEQIGDIAGVCGNISEPQSYSFTDYTPVKNYTNYYKLHLGGTGFSEVLKIGIRAIGASGYQVVTNPSSEQSRIYFSNERRQLFSLLLYSMKGKLMNTLDTSNDFFDLQTAGLPAGLYIFSMIEAETQRAISGKLLVP
ncbi:MAG TPA: hypothetical protein PLU53_01730 [Bacteroidia bacterium]|nr:hypothetical protein [Bacteroidia bacterium]